jgi:hypothetical protein
MAFGPKMGRYMEASEITEIAWAAGFFDGEGHTRNTLKYGGYFQIQIEASQSGEYAPEILERFRVALGCGWVRAEKRSLERQQVYRFAASGKQAKTALLKMWPYLSIVKKIQAMKAIAENLEIEQARQILVYKRNKNV